MLPHFLAVVTHRGPGEGPRLPRKHGPSRAGPYSDGVEKAEA